MPHRLFKSIEKLLLEGIDIFLFLPVPVFVVLERAVGPVYERKDMSC